MSVTAILTVICCLISFCHLGHAVDVLYIIDMIFPVTVQIPCAGYKVKEHFGEIIVPFSAQWGNHKVFVFCKF